MKVCVLLLFFAIQSSLCMKETKEQKLVEPVINERCKNIKCTRVEDPRCVMIRHKKNLTQIMYVIAVNKCEIQYMKCHEDFDAKIVPMKHCGHNGHELKFKSNKKNKTGHIRAKRDVKPVSTQTARKHNSSKKYESTKAKLNNNLKRRRYNSGDDSEVKLFEGRRRGRNFRDSDYSDYEGEGGHKVFISRHDRHRNERADDSVRNKAPSRMKITGLTGEAGFLIRKEDVYDENQVWPLSMASILADDDVPEGQSGYKVQIEQIYDENEVWPAGDAAHSSDASHGFMHVHNNHVKDKNGGVDEDTEFPLVSRESINMYKSATKKPDPQFDDNCPDYCPSRSVMVCARCQHGVYKTFVSVCHMRMFTCMYSEEVLHLVSRYPCILSAPYISAKGMEPQGEVREANDEDTVLRFIKCRGYGRLKSNHQDPRCAFEEADEENE